MKFYPHGGTSNLVSYLQSASLAVTASHLENPNRPVLSASLALSAPLIYTGPSGASGTNQTVTGPQGPSGSTGPVGPRGFGSYTGSLTTATCCAPFDTYCVGVDLYTYDGNCVGSLSCINYITCGGTNTECE
jgi:hypothetical protein